MNFVFFFNDTATTEIYTLSLHDALPIFRGPHRAARAARARPRDGGGGDVAGRQRADHFSPDRVAQLAARHLRGRGLRSEEHTSELQSRQYLVCRLLLEKKKIILDYLLAT